MSHEVIYNIFKRMMPIYGDKVIMWFPNGYSSIRIRLSTKEEYIFTYSSDRNWRFETVDNYISSMKGKN